MFRTAALVALALSFVGCSQFQPARRPFAKPKKDPPPPYGSPVSAVPNAPVANQSQLGIATADPAPPRSGDDPPLIPAKDVRPVSSIVPAAPPANRNLADLNELVSTARASWKGINGYEGSLTRRELNPKGVVNSEVLVYQFRREPMSVYSRTTAGNGKGREVLYAPAKHGDKMHIVLGDGDSKLAKAGFKPDPISPDDSQVRAKARYSIRDAGFGKWIERLGTAVAQLERGALAPGALTFDGPVSRPEFAHPLTGVTHRLKPGDDPAMPDGGTRVYLFDTAPGSPSCGMPLVITATDPTGREVEFYLFEKFRASALTDADFSPARLGKK
ncbi:MAG: DUF1571 domain-containing protein [Planctomycetes bacterium]|nr:DUF1571 domain-containing protein [Planctomycetota bacterium]